MKPHRGGLLVDKWAKEVKRLSTKRTSTICKSWYIGPKQSILFKNIPKYEKCPSFLGLNHNVKHSDELVRLAASLDLPFPYRGLDKSYLKNFAAVQRLAEKLRPRKKNNRAFSWAEDDEQSRFPKPSI